MHQAVTNTTDKWLEVAHAGSIPVAYGGGREQFRVEFAPETQLIWERGKPYPVGIYLSLYECNGLGERRLIDVKRFQIVSPER